MNKTKNMHVVYGQLFELLRIACPRVLKMKVWQWVRDGILCYIGALNFVRSHANKIACSSEFVHIFIVSFTMHPKVTYINISFRAFPMEVNYHLFMY